MHTSKKPFSTLDFGLASMRLILGVVFAFHGAQKLFGWFGGYGIEGTSQFFESIGLPLPTLNVYLAGGAELIGGLALLLGILSRSSAVLLAFTMLVASVTAHSGFAAAGGGMEFPLTLGVVALGLALTGPGRLVVPLPAFLKAGEGADWRAPNCLNHARSELDGLRAGSHPQEP